MPRAKLTLDIPAETWVSEVSVAHPEATVRVRTALAGAEAGIAIAELVTADPIPLLSAIADRVDVAAADLLATREDGVVVQVETTTPTRLTPLWQAGVPVELPFTVRDGEATWTVTTSATRFAALGQALDETGVDYQLEFSRDVGGDRGGHVMTDRQREVLLAALEQGYYATPREATLTEVAAALDISKAACSDILHRAEGNLVDWFATAYLEWERSPLG